MDDGEVVTWVIDPEDYKADALFVFENGRVARVALSGYATKTNRKRLKNAIYCGAKLLYAQVLEEDPRPRARVERPSPRQLQYLAFAD